MNEKRIFKDLDAVFFYSGPEVEKMVSMIRRNHGFDISEETARELIEKWVKERGYKIGKVETVLIP